MSLLNKFSDMKKKMSQKADQRNKRSQATNEFNKIVNRIVEPSFCTDIDNYISAVRILNNFDETNGYFGNNYSILSVADRYTRATESIKDEPKNVAQVYCLLCYLPLFCERYHIVDVDEIDSDSAILLLQTDLKVFDPHDMMTEIGREAKANLLSSLSDAKSTADLALGD